MEQIMKADIFFFISSVATVVLGIMASILLFYLIRAGRNLYFLSDSLKDGFKGSEEFVLELRDRLEDNVIFRFIFPPRRRKRPAKDSNIRNNN